MISPDDINKCLITILWFVIPKPVKKCSLLKNLQFSSIANLLIKLTDGKQWIASVRFFEWNFPLLTEGRTIWIRTSPICNMSSQASHYSSNLVQLMVRVPFSPIWICENDNVEHLLEFIDFRWFLKWLTLLDLLKVYSHLQQLNHWLYQLELLLGS